MVAYRVGSVVAYLRSSPSCAGRSGGIPTPFRPRLGWAGAGSPTVSHAASSDGFHRGIMSTTESPGTGADKVRDTERPEGTVDEDAIRR